MHPAERLSEFVDGRLPAEDARDLHAHLEVCATCQREVEELLALRRLLREVAAPEPREVFWVRLNAQVEEERRRLSRRRLWRGAAVVGVAALAAVVLAMAPIPEVSAPVDGYIREHARYRLLHPLTDGAAVTLVGTDASLRLELGETP